MYMVQPESTFGVEKVLHSKLKTGNWPNVAVILEKIHFYLPRVPKVQIKVFKEQRGRVADEEGELKDLKVTLKSSYHNT